MDGDDFSGNENPGVLVVSESELYGVNSQEADSEITIVGSPDQESSRVSGGRPYSHSQKPSKNATLRDASSFDNSTVTPSTSRRLHSQPEGGRQPQRRSFRKRTGRETSATKSSRSRGKSTLQNSPGASTASSDESELPGTNSEKKFSVRRTLNRVKNKLKKEEAKQKGRLQSYLSARFLPYTRRKRNAQGELPEPEYEKFQHGTDPCGNDNTAPGLNISEGRLREILREELQSHQQAVPGSLSTPVRHLTRSAATSLFGSPVTRPTEGGNSACAARPARCSYPHNEVRIECSGRDARNKQCKYWVHAVCVGFPLASNEDIPNMPDYYCPNHVTCQAPIL